MLGQFKKDLEGDAERKALIRVDLHLHTKYSFDASIDPTTLVDQLYAHSSIEAVAVTDHNTLEGYFKVKKLASSYQDVLIIPGIEVSTTRGDLLILGAAEVPRAPWTVESVVDFAEEREALTVVPHPYGAYGLGDLAKNLDVDAIEVSNGRLPSSLNRLAVRLAKETGLPGVAGSDAHSVNELWTAYTEVNASLQIDEILEAIKAGCARPVSRGNSIHF